MKRLIFICFITLIFWGCKNKNSGDEIVSDMLQKLGKSEFFKVQHDYTMQKSQLNEKNQLFIGAYLNYVFREHQASNDKISRLISQYKEELADSIIYELLAIKTANYVQLYDYKSAAETHAQLLKDYVHLMDTSAIINRQNNQNEYEALKNVPGQTIDIKDDCLIPTKRDTIGLLNVKVDFTTQEKDTLIDFVFDTGADVNIIQKSKAEYLGLKPIEGENVIGGSTGYIMERGFAVADSISLGEIKFYNVVFSVLPDEYLNVAPELNYSITGIIGSPVIKMMEELRFKENEIMIPKSPEVYKFQNFALNNSSSIVLCMHNGDSLRFNFDTGARKTNLYKLFFEEYKSEIQNKYQEQDFTSGGLGETLSNQGFILDTFTFEIAGAKCTLDSVKLHINSIPNFVDLNLHGNLGQDFMNSFDEMIISYKYSSIKFK